MRNRPESSIAGGSSADIHRLSSVPLTAPEAYRYLLAHVPAGMRVLGDGRGTGPGGLTMLQVSYQPRSVPAGTDYAMLVAEIVPGHSGQALLRTDGEVAWFPARSAQEHLAAAQFAQVTVSARVYNPRLHTVQRVLRSPAAIARLAAILNALPASPGLATSCQPSLLLTGSRSRSPPAPRPR